MLLSFVIPCYRSEHTITQVVKEIIDTVNQRDGYDYEIILVNDGSPDGVIDVINYLCKCNNKIKGINLAKNFGQSNAKMAGFKYATGDYIFSLDDDGQIAVDELFKLVDKIDEGYDAVYARYSEKKHSFLRNLGSKVNKSMSHSLVGKPKELSLSSFMVIRPFLVNEILKYNNPFPYPLGIIVASTNKIANVDTNHRKRVMGKSGYNFKKLLKFWIDGATNFSIKPIRISVLLGVLSAFLGFIYGGYIIISKLLGGNIQPGWSSIISIMLFMSGVILCVLGIIGEYVGRIYMSLNNIPQYVVKDEININKIEKDLQEEINNV